MSKKLTIDNTEAFKKYALERLGTYRDLFHFVGGHAIDWSTNKEIPFLDADGYLSWDDGVKILETHFRQTFMYEDVLAKMGVVIGKPVSEDRKI